MYSKIDELQGKYDNLVNQTTCFQQRLEPLQKLASQMQAKIDAVEAKFTCFESKVPDALDLSRVFDQKLQLLESSVEEQIALASTKSADPTEWINKMQKDIDDTRSSIEKTKALIPDVSSLQSKVNNIEVTMTDY